VFQVVDRIVILRRGQKVASDIDPKKTTIEEVEHIITGMTSVNEERPA
jgi:simple sugar transport system ATP-binding protein